ncbi:MAG TPA: phage tail protein [Streptosporangiaceae bacterium]|nr:phage tail protein [Streptosporangiaceae bacterium]
MVSMPVNGLAKALPKGLPVTGQLKFQHYGMAMRFSVTIDGLDLGHWSFCDGLKVEFKTDRVTDGGHYDHQAILPVTVAYGSITLKRAMIQPDSDKVKEWLSKVARQWVGDDALANPYKAGTATIKLLDVCGRKVQEWVLREVYPVSWSGPTLSAEQSKVAIETLVIEHEGFL